ncbi:MAG TPA: MFS transporter [Dermatophilaceae bacterium]|nr:MFS transporter [Dermatophilaceae bacterium]
MPTTAPDGSSPPTEPFSLRRIAVPAFGPSALASVGAGATLPVVVLGARDLGASVSVAALVFVVSGLAELVVALPAGGLVARIGERGALVGAALLEAAAGLLAWSASGLLAYFAAMVLFGATSAVFLLARLAYLTDHAPVHLRARAMSTLGGVHRIGLFVGPFLGAAVVAVWGTRSAFLVATAASLAAAAVAWRTVELGGAAAPGASGGPPRPGPSTLEVVRRHRHVLLTVGLGVTVISVARASRVVLLPLWAEHVGLSPAQTSLVFGVAGGVEMLLFYPAGSVMDRFGRVWVAVPSVLVLGVGLLVLPLTSALAGLGAVAVVMGIGNGLSSGIVMTLGADAAPVEGRTRFLGVWRLLSLLGNNGGPLVVSAVAGFVGLAAASLSTGALVVAGAAWLARWLPGQDPRRAAAAHERVAGG